jgi:hypothetical protein
MSDVQLLFLVLALLYGWECACWMRRGSVAFTTWLGRTWHLAHPGTLFGNQRGGFVFAAPLPPLGTIFTANPFPLSLSPDAVLAYVATNVNRDWRPAQSGKILPFDALREVEAKGKKVIVRGEPLWSAPTLSLARHVAETLKRLAALSLAQREKAIHEFIRDGLDSGVVEQRWKEFQQPSRYVRVLGNVLLVYLFVLTPLVIWNFGFRHSWLGLLGGLALLTVTTAVSFHRAHKKLYLAAEDERFTHTLTIALSPPNAVRACDALSRPLFEALHPLAVAKVFLPPSRFRQFAREALLDIRHPALPVTPSDDPAARATELFARSALRQAVEQLLQRDRLDPDELCRPPAPADESCRAYCPRCGAQFTNVNVKCADCGGLPLAAFMGQKACG